MTAPLVSMTDRPFQLLPPLSSEQRHLLRESIRTCGVLEPVVFDEDGEILDGHHRVEIAEELGIEYPRRIVDDLDRPGKFAYALTVNVARRHLDQAARSGLVAQLRLRGMSIREIAKTTGINRETVRRDLASGDTGVSPDRITGADGKTYAASRPAAERIQSPGPVDAAASPPADPGVTPEPGADLSAAQPGPVEPAPAADAPAPPQEPDRHLRSVPMPPAEMSPEGKALADEIARDSTRRVTIRNLTSVLTFLNPVSIHPVQLAKQEYAPVLDAFEQEDLDRAAQTMTAIAAMKRGM